MAWRTTTTTPQATTSHRARTSQRSNRTRAHLSLWLCLCLCARARKKKICALFAIFSKVSWTLSPAQPAQHTTKPRVFSIPQARAWIVVAAVVSPGGSKWTDRDRELAPRTLTDDRKQLRSSCPISQGKICGLLDSRENSRARSREKDWEHAGVLCPGREIVQMFFSIGNAVSRDAVVLLLHRCLRWYGVLFDSDYCSKAECFECTAFWATIKIL